MKQPVQGGRFPLAPRNARRIGFDKPWCVCRLVRAFDRYGWHAQPSNQECAHDCPFFLSSSGDTGGAGDNPANTALWSVPTIFLQVFTRGDRMATNAPNVPTDSDELWGRVSSLQRQRWPHRPHLSPDNAEDSVRSLPENGRLDGIYPHASHFRQSWLLCKVRWLAVEVSPF